MGKTQLENFHYVHATQYVTSRMKTAGKKFCSLCLAERVNIFIAMNSEGSNKLMNKKSEFTGACSCKARFLRLYFKGVGGADEVSSGCRKLSCEEICATGIKTNAKRKPDRPKKYLIRYKQAPGSPYV